MRYQQWQPYKPVAQRRAEAKLAMYKLQEDGLDVQPIEIQGRKIAKSFWGIAWCDNLESYGQLANRIERGRTYARNGSVCHLAIAKGRVTAMVSGSDLYNVSVTISPLPKKRWQGIKEKCTGKVSSILSLLQGRLPDTIMETVTNQKTGLFPTPDQINFSCDCPDGAYMCKHIAAVLYGIGARLDHQPELLFSLRAVDHQELVSADIKIADKAPTKGSRRRIASEALSDVFGIDMADESAPAATPRRPSKKSTAKKTAKKLPKKKVAKKKTTKPFEATAANVKALRKKFNMTPIEFALLLGISTQTVNNWEAKSGKLNLRSHNKTYLLEVATYSKNKAWKAMEDL